MLDQRLRPTKTTILEPLVDRLPVIGADRLTAIGVVLGVSAALAASFAWWWLAIVLFLMNRVVDGLDGEVARRDGAASDAGGYADIVGDTIVYAAIPIGASIGSAIDHVWPVTAALLASFYLNTITWTYLAAILEKRAAARHTTTSVVMPAGLIEGTETIAFFVVMLAIPAWLDWTMGVMASFVAVGAGIRFAQGRRAIGNGATMFVAPGRRARS